MNTTTQRSSACHRRHGFAATAFLAALALLTLAGVPFPAAAQSIITTTLLPSKVESANGTPANESFETTGNIVLRFPAPASPFMAELVKATLQLTCKDTLRSADGEVKVKMVGSEANFGSRSFRRDLPKAGQPLRWTTTDGSPALKNFKEGTAFALELVPDITPNNPARQWYSLNAESRYRPRLILEYNVPGRAAVTQTEGVSATHSPRAFLGNPNNGVQFGSRAVSSIWSYSPVFTKGNVCLITGGGNASQLQAFPPLGGPPFWSVPLTNPGQHLVRGGSRLYIVGSQQIRVYQNFGDINPQLPASEIIKPSGNGPLSPKSVPNLNPTLPPAVGPDDSLYFVNGQEVYGLNPNLEELWKVTLDVPLTSRLTVGPSGRFVYLLGQMAGVMSLIAIDARTGEVSTGRLSVSDPTTLHAPVVLQGPDETEKIYVAANSSTTGSLVCFDNSSRIVKGEKSWTLRPTENWPPVNGLVGQPTVGSLTPFVPEKARELYCVTVANGQGQLRAIDWLKGTVRTVGNTFPAGDWTDFLQRGAPVVDKDENVFIRDGAEGRLHVFAGPAASSYTPTPLPGITANARLLFGSDGTLYAMDPPNAATRTLWGIIPQYLLNDASKALLSSPTHLRVDGTVSKATTLTAPGNVFLGNGFTVRRGATLSIPYTTVR